MLLLINLSLILWQHIRDHLSSKWTFTAGASFLCPVAHLQFPLWKVFLPFFGRKLSSLWSPFTPSFCSLNAEVSIGRVLLTVWRAISSCNWASLIKLRHLKETPALDTHLLQQDVSIVLHLGLIRPLYAKGSKDNVRLGSWDAQACMHGRLQHAQISNRFRI